MVAIYDSSTGARTHLAPVPEYDHPAYCEGWEAAQSSTYVARDGERFLRLKEWENPYDAYTDSEAFSQWRQGYWAAIEDGERLAWEDEDDDFVRMPIGEP